MFKNCVGTMMATAFNVEFQLFLGLEPDPDLELELTSTSGRNVFFIIFAFRKRSTFSKMHYLKFHLKQTDD